MARIHNPRPYRLGKPIGCDIENCERPHYVNGLCIPHWQRRQKYGDSLAGPSLRKQRKQSQRTNTRSEYHVNHARVYKDRGPAWRLACEFCDARAASWATKHGAEGKDPDDFMPLCWSCHAKYDDFVKRFPDNTGSRRSSESREKMRQAALLREARKRGEVT